jgi:tetratricopeptide (TPR) repeat protein/predicted Ser/Thr protein kinase
VTKCPFCSGEIADAQRFCGECGTSLPASSRRSPPDRGPVGEAEETILLPTAELPLGSVFAHRYQVVEELGAGGMGRVYRVLDKKVGEEIALKLIRPDIASDRRILERFAAELKLARQVVHRNVARMFDLNEEGHVPYITMEYVRGENLKRLIRKVGRLAPAQALPIASQICAGLDEAHRLGIVHRDLKPQNVMIDEDGQARILDFGLAQVRSGGKADKRSFRSGTPAYVSPEQLQGRSADERSDLYSLGVVLYEMLTGHTPFQAEDLNKLFEMHLSEPPRDPQEINPGISEELSRVVMKCLEKDPAARYQTAGELGQALGCLMKSPPAQASRGKRWALRIGAGATGLAILTIFAYLVFGLPDSWKRSVAVLPIEGTGIEEANRKLLDGLQRELSDRLYGIPDLRVVPDFTVNSYDLDGKTTPQKGKILGVGYLVQVTVAVEGGVVDGKIYLVDVKNNTTSKPMTFRRDLSSYRALQNEIAMATAKALGVELTAGHLEKFSRRGTDNIEAYGLFLEGMRFLDEEEAAGDVERAIKTLQQAVDIDPDYALGHWGLGYAYEYLYYDQEKGKNPEDLKKMYFHLHRASMLDPTLAATNLGLGWYYFYKEDNARAFQYFQKALRLEPDNYLIIRDTGAFLRSIGLYRESLPFLKRAAKLSPRDPFPLSQIAQCWLFLGRCEKALTYTGKALARRESDLDANIMHTVLLALTGRFDEADRQIKAMERFDFPNTRLPFLRETVSALRQGRGRPYTFISDVPSLSPQGTYLYLSFDMKEEALANIQKAIDAGLVKGMYFYSYPSLVKNPWYKVFRDEPRFQDILKRQKERYDKALKPFEKL